ncbi:hypothetical protein ACFWVP_21350 [Streptomyces sp. NPDC058637]|uniref:hypothetical protein n=1 Tax=Streptomyces sp. NPDC058637 TaxID=3346569 RepID=UPI00366853EA
MLIPPRVSRTSLGAAAALGAAGLIALGVTPTAVADEAAAELVVRDIAPIGGVKPGSSFGPPVTFDVGVTFDDGTLWGERRRLRSWSRVGRSTRTHVWWLTAVARFLQCVMFGSLVGGVAVPVVNAYIMDE